MSTTFYENKTLADVETGEVLSIHMGDKLTSAEERSLKEKYAKRDKAKQRPNIFYAPIKNKCGSFHWLSCKPTDEIFEGLSPVSVSRLMYLMTYADYDNQLVFDRERKDKVKALSLSDIRGIMKLTDRTFYRFWAEVCSNKYVYEKNGVYYISKTLIYKGDRNKRDMMTLKVFTSAIRSLYNATNKNTHKSLSYLYRLIPMLNVHYNILCDNPFEKDKSKIQSLTMADICERLGVDVSNQTKIAKQLFELSFTDKEGNERSAVSLVIDRKNLEKRIYVIVNPQIYSAFISNVNLVKLLAIDSGEFDISDLENAL